MLISIRYKKITKLNGNNFNDLYDESDFKLLENWEKSKENIYVEVQLNY